MAYADQKMSGGKITALVIVALLHALLGYALVTGLALSVVKKATEKLNTFDVEEPPPPPPPEEPPPPPPDVPQLQPPPVVTPPPIVRNPNPPPVVVQSVPTPPPVFVPTPIAAPPAPPAPVAAPPAPPPPRVSKAAGLRGNPGQFFGADNYPPAAIRAGAEGRVVARLSVGADGRVSDCTVTTSSGNSDLDNTTCRIARSRVRFTPAQDQEGNPIASTYTLPVRWELPED
ncbi:energy transducer TonB [Sphingomonas lenta]|uniref:Energy transducer TonB n=1 Tax=Sphingomonas lenta TaxID=1141887 RepID=A0A2A2SBE7_9SPHN|nr:energy transducer TonB [Sphingomonas lenta]PAX06578.1 energy transducer TonB [Sphingomonas lenta]